MKKFVYYVIALVIAASSPSAQGDVVITVEVDPPVNAGDIASVSFYATSPSGQQVTGFNLPVDIGPVGTVLPSELSFLPGDDSVGSAIAGAFGTLETGPILQLNNTDAVVNVAGFDPIALSNTPTLIFDLLLTVSGSAEPGSFPVTINNGDTPGAGFSFTISDENNAEILSSLTSVNPGSVNIVAAVPEPSSLALAMLALGGLTLRRQRNK